MSLFDKIVKRAAAPGAAAGSELELWSEAGNSLPSTTPDWRAMLLLLRRNGVWIAATASLAALLCVIAIRLAFDQYSATATILFDPRDAKVTGAPDVLPDIGPDSIAIESLVQVAKSDGFLTALADQEELSKDPEFAGGDASVVEQKAATLEKLR
ncbi:MAG: Wzz/FepE/Etk N-terminal domain-containing protein, partial [Roseiarcus sp.]